MYRIVGLIVGVIAVGWLADRLGVPSWAEIAAVGLVIGGALALRDRKRDG